jgi:exopolysaccharide production protein ExoZ
MERDKQAGIQIARAVAALSIVYMHSWVPITRFPEGTAHPIPFLNTYGWLGVDFFFAISGYVICLVVSRDTFAVWPFLIKRVLRLYPLWLLMLSIFAATAWLWRGLLPTETLGFFLYSATLGLTDGFPFYNIGWSLQHEMVFYLMAAIIAPLFGVAGLVVVLIASYLAFAFQLVTMPWYLSALANHHGEFLAGALAFMVSNRLTPFGFWIPAAIGVPLLALLAVIGNSQLLPFALFFLVVAFANIKTVSRWGRPVVLVGDASYSLYLIHPMVFFTASAVVSKFPGLPLWTQEPIRFACILLAIGLSLLSWEHFEKRAIRFGNRLVYSNTQKTFGMAEA